MKKAIIPCTAIVALAMVFAGVNYTNAQLENFPIANQIADKVIAKYQNSPCEELQQKKSKPPQGPELMMMQKAVAELKNNPEMRTAFINKVAGPIANKMFDCGMIP